MTWNKDISDSQREETVAGEHQRQAVLAQVPEPHDAAARLDHAVLEQKVAGRWEVLQRGPHGGDAAARLHRDAAHRAREAFQLAPGRAEQSHHRFRRLVEEQGEHSRSRRKRRSSSDRGRHDNPPVIVTGAYLTTFGKTPSCDI